MADPFKDLIDSRAAAELFSISYDNFRARVSRGHIPETAQVRIGTALLFRRRELKKLARQLNQTGPGLAPNPRPKSK